MKCFTPLFLGLVSSLYGGSICEYKIKQAQAGLDAYMQKPHKDSHKLQNAQDELNSLLKHCDDKEILEEISRYIISMKSALTRANLALTQAKESGDKSAIHQATLAQKIAQRQYIAARQEELRLKDLLKDNP